MIGRNRYKNRAELLQGTLDMLILRTLQWGPQHGYGIVQALRVNRTRWEQMVAAVAAIMHGEPEGNDA
jgi:hypothetical protein